MPRDGKESCEKVVRFSQKWNMDSGDLGAEGKLTLNGSTISVVNVEGTTTENSLERKPVATIKKLAHLAHGQLHQ